VRWIRYEGLPLWKQKLRPNLGKLPRWLGGRYLVRSLYETDSYNHARAATTGFHVLGPDAKTAIPELIRTLKKAKGLSVLAEVTGALASIGKPALPELLELLTDSNKTNRFIAVTAICFSENGVSGAAVNELIKRLHDSNQGAATSAAASLAVLGLDLSKTVRALWSALRDPRPPVQLAAAEALKALAQSNSATLVALDQARAAENVLRLPSDRVLLPPALSSGVRQTARELVGQTPRELIETANLEAAGQTNRQAN